MLALLVAVAGGCGGESSFYAGMDEGEAPQEALSAIGREVRAPGSPLYRHRMRIAPGAEVTRGRSSTGEEAWIVPVEDATERATWCVRVWANTALNVRQYEAEIAPCDGEPEEAPPS